MAVLPKLLLVDDEPSVRLVLNRFLSTHGFEVIESGDGAEAIQLVKTCSPNLIVLDIEMPGLDGWATLAQLRALGCLLPVLVLTNTDDVSAKVKGLESGADDYLGKPCDLLELRARIRALLRRSQGVPVAKPRLRIGATVIDLERKSAMQGDVPVHLTRKEFAMLDLLAQNRGKPVSRDRLLRDVWEFTRIPNSHTLDTHLWRLRRKLGDSAGESQWIRNLPGMGFALECEVEPGPAGDSDSATAPARPSE